MTEFAEEAKRKAPLNVSAENNQKSWKSPAEVHLFSKVAGCNFFRKEYPHIHF